jgi:beta-glucanase (GH16 family)
MNSVRVFLLGVTMTCGWLAQPCHVRAALPNAGFESAGGSLNEWATFNNAIGNVSAQPITPRGGTHVAKLYGSFDSDPNYSGLIQNRPAYPGETWTAEAFTRHNTGDALTGSNNALIMKIEFYRSPGADYGSADFLAEHSLTVLDGNAPTDVWLSASLTAEAPAETVEARIAFVFRQEAGATGAALIDDVTFSSDWTLVWSDEFDGPTVDPSKWRVEDAFIEKNNELQYYAPDDVFIDNGKLVLRSQERWYAGHPYTSGLVESNGRFAQAYGRFEIRAKLPTGQGLWPAIWMLPTRPVWPPEIDIMELIGSQPNRVVMSMHWGPVPPGQYPWDIGQTANGDFWGPDFSQGFHTFAIEWMPGRLYWLIDDVVRLSVIRPEIPAEPMFFILNTAVGGDWPGSPDGSTVFPQFHEIDYVRVYLPSDPGPPLAEWTDLTAAAAVADGSIGTSEYAGATAGINSGFGDRIGENSMFHVDSGADDWVNFAIASDSAWPDPAPDGVVIYIDSQPGGFPSTYELNQSYIISQQLASGNGSQGQRCELFFAPGFLADYAICLEDGAAIVYTLGKSGHQLQRAALLNSPTDTQGGTDLRYYANGLTRELRARLSDIGVAEGGSFDFVVTMLNGDIAFRSNEFVGVAAGNPWDGDNIGVESGVLKRGDFIRFHTAPAWFDLDLDGDIDLADHALFSDCFAGPNVTTPPAGCSAQQFGNADADGDNDVDLHDAAALTRALTRAL